jgi:hypothetical protein
VGNGDARCHPAAPRSHSPCRGSPPARALDLAFRIALGDLAGNIVPFKAVLMGLVGMRFAPDGVRFHPLLPPDLTRVVLRGLPYRSMPLDIVLSGPGDTVATCAMNGQPSERAFLPAGTTGAQRIELVVRPSAGGDEDGGAAEAASTK